MNYKKDEVAGWEALGAAVLNDAEKTTALLDRAKKDAAIFRDKYSTLKECSGIIKQITAFIGE